MTPDLPWRIVVLDDDPTGTQTVADLPIILTPDLRTLRAAGQRWSGSLWVLTNTRALRWEDAEPLLAGIVERVRTVFGPSVQLVLRGDSTLRGHVLGEIDTLSTPHSVALFVPAFVEEGRVTIHGVHYVTIGGRRVEVAATEYARDPEFAYRASDLVGWVADREPGRIALGLAVETLRTAGPSVLTELLLSAPAHSVVAPDAETVEDIQLISEAWSQAAQRGRPVVLRCAASMAGVVTRSAKRALTLDPVDGPVLVVCASYTTGATEQLAALEGMGNLAWHVLDVAQVISGGPDADAYCLRVADEVHHSLQSERITVLSTSRDTAPGTLNFAAGERIMNAVVAVVAGLRLEFSVLVTKGGITSARIARDALGVRVALVRGQVLPGIPVWTLDYPLVHPVEQVVVPGNVGEPTALLEIVGQLTSSRPKYQDS